MDIACRTSGRLAALAISVLIGAAAIVFAPQRAAALPSFARQTGQPCGTCHTDFPALTPFGRRFKLLGYTMGGGQFRTTPFSSFSTVEEQRAQDNAMRNYVKAPASGVGQGDNKDKEYVPPISFMAVVGLTHTQAAMSGMDPYNSNDNVVASPISAFWGGAITDHLGAFAQVTYGGTPAGGFADPFGHTWGWDNTDVRYARTANVGGVDLIYGITANNNPTVQDVWNTTPAWYFPYFSSTLAPTPNKTMIEGGWGPGHVSGVGAYAYVNDKFYIEVTGYRTLGFSAQNSMGVDPLGAAGLFDGIAPYWRVAFEPQWGRHSFMIGTFGMIFNVHPWADPAFAIGSTATFPQTDKYTDIGFDSQYQYQGDNY
jgi:hypothetical protein